MKMKRRSYFGWVELIVGILFIVFGIYAFVNPSVALGSIVVIYGALALVSGIADILFYVRIEKATRLGPPTALAAGILSIILGVMLLFNIGAGAWALTMLFPIWFIIHCIARLANLGFVRRRAGTAQYVISLIVNIIGLVLGVLLLFNPFASAVSLVYVVGFYSVIIGSGGIVSAIGKIGE